MGGKAICGKALSTVPQLWQLTAQRAFPLQFKAARWAVASFAFHSAAATAIPVARSADCGGAGAAAFSGEKLMQKQGDQLDQHQYSHTALSSEQLERQQQQSQPDSSLSTSPPQQRRLLLHRRPADVLLETSPTGQQCVLAEQSSLLQHQQQNFANPSTICNDSIFREKGAGNDYSRGSSWVKVDRSRTPHRTVSSAVEPPQRQFPLHRVQQQQPLTPSSAYRERIPVSRRDAPAVDAAEAAGLLTGMNTAAGVGREVSVFAAGDACREAAVGGQPFSFLEALALGALRMIDEELSMHAIEKQGQLKKEQQLLRRQQQVTVLQQQQQRGSPPRQQVRREQAAVFAADSQAQEQLARRKRLVKVARANLILAVFADVFSEGVSFKLSAVHRQADIAVRPAVRQSAAVASSASLKRGTESEHSVLTHLFAEPLPKTRVVRYLEWLPASLRAASRGAAHAALPAALVAREPSANADVGERRLRDAILPSGRVWFEFFLRMKELHAHGVALIQFPQFIFFMQAVLPQFPFVFEHIPRRQSSQFTSVSVTDSQNSNTQKKQSVQQQQQSKPWERHERLQQRAIQQHEHQAQTSAIEELSKGGSVKIFDQSCPAQTQPSAMLGISSTEAGGGAAAVHAANFQKIRDENELSNIAPSDTSDHLREPSTTAAESPQGTKPEKKLSYLNVVAQQHMNATQSIWPQLHVLQRKHLLEALVEMSLPHTCAKLIHNEITGLKRAGALVQSGWLTTLNSSLRACACIIYDQLKLPRTLQMAVAVALNAAGGLPTRSGSINAVSSASHLQSKASMRKQSMTLDAGENLAGLDDATHSLQKNYTDATSSVVNDKRRYRETVNEVDLATIVRDSSGDGATPVAAAGATATRSSLQLKAPRSLDEPITQCGYAGASHALLSCWQYNWIAFQLSTDMPPQQKHKFFFHALPWAPIMQRTCDDVYTQISTLRVQDLARLACSTRVRQVHLLRLHNHMKTQQKQQQWFENSNRNNNSSGFGSQAWQRSLTGAPPLLCPIAGQDGDWRSLLDGLYGAWTLFGDSVTSVQSMTELLSEPDFSWAMSEEPEHVWLRHAAQLRVFGRVFPELEKAECFAAPEQLNGCKPLASEAGEAGTSFLHGVSPRLIKERRNAPVTDGIRVEALCDPHFLDQRVDNKDFKPETDSCTSNNNAVELLQREPEEWLSLPRTVVALEHIYCKAAAALCQVDPDHIAEVFQYCARAFVSLMLVASFPSPAAAISTSDACASLSAGFKNRQDGMFVSSRLPEGPPLFQKMQEHIFHVAPFPAERSADSATLLAALVLLCARWRRLSETRRRTLEEVDGMATEQRRQQQKLHAWAAEEMRSLERIFQHIRTTTEVWYMTVVQNPNLRDSGVRQLLLIQRVLREIEEVSSGRFMVNKLKERPTPAKAAYAACLLAALTNCQTPAASSLKLDLLELIGTWCFRAFVHGGSPWPSAPVGPPFQPALLSGESKGRLGYFPASPVPLLPYTHLVTLDTSPLLSQSEMSFTFMLSSSYFFQVLFDAALRPPCSSGPPAAAPATALAGPVHSSCMQQGLELQTRLQSQLIGRPPAAETAALGAPAAFVLQASSDAMTHPSAVAAASPTTTTTTNANLPTSLTTKTSPTITVGFPTTTPTTTTILSGLPNTTAGVPTTTTPTTTTTIRAGLPNTTTTTIGAGLPNTTAGVPTTTTPTTTTTIMGGGLPSSTAGLPTTTTPTTTTTIIGAGLPNTTTTTIMGGGLPSSTDCAADGDAVFSKTLFAEHRSASGGGGLRIIDPRGGKRWTRGLAIEAAVESALHLPVLLPKLLHLWKRRLLAPEQLPLKHLMLCASKNTKSPVLSSGISKTGEAQVLSVGPGSCFFPFPTSRLKAEERKPIEFPVPALVFFLCRAARLSVLLQDAAQQQQQHTHTHSGTEVKDQQHHSTHNVYYAEKKPPTKNPSEFIPVLNTTTTNVISTETTRATKIVATAANKEAAKKASVFFTSQQEAPVVFADSLGRLRRDDCEVDVREIPSFLSASSEAGEFAEVLQLSSVSNVKTDLAADATSGDNDTADVVQKQTAGNSDSDLADKAQYSAVADEEALEDEFFTDLAVDEYGEAYIKKAKPAAGEQPQQQNDDFTGRTTGAQVTDLKASKNTLGSSGYSFSVAGEKKATSAETEDAADIPENPGLQRGSIADVSKFAEPLKRVTLATCALALTVIDEELQCMNYICKLESAGASSVTIDNSVFSPFSSAQVYRAALSDLYDAFDLLFAHNLTTAPPAQLQELVKETRRLTALPAYLPLPDESQPIHNIPLDRSEDGQSTGKAISKSPTMDVEQRQRQQQQQLQQLRHWQEARRENAHSERRCFFHVAAFQALLMRLSCPADPAFSEADKLCLSNFIEKTSVDTDSLIDCTEYQDHVDGSQNAACDAEGFPFHVEGGISNGEGGSQTQNEKVLVKLRSREKANMCQLFQLLLQMLSGAPATVCHTVFPQLLEERAASIVSAGGSAGELKGTDITHSTTILLQKGFTFFFKEIPYMPLPRLARLALVIARLDLLHSLRVDSSYSAHCVKPETAADADNIHAGEDGFVDGPLTAVGLSGESAAWALPPLHLHHPQALLPNVAECADAPEGLHLLLNWDNRKRRSEQKASGGFEAKGGDGGGCFLRTAKSQGSGNKSVTNEERFAAAELQRTLEKALRVQFSSYTGDLPFSDVTMLLWSLTVLPRPKPDLLVTLFGRLEAILCFLLKQKRFLAGADNLPRHLPCAAASPIFRFLQGQLMTHCARLRAAWASQVMEADPSFTSSLQKRFPLSWIAYQLLQSEAYLAERTMLTETYIFPGVREKRAAATALPLVTSITQMLVKMGIKIEDCAFNVTIPGLPFRYNLAVASRRLAFIVGCHCAHSEAVAEAEDPLLSMGDIITDTVTYTPTAPLVVAYKAFSNNGSGKLENVKQASEHERDCLQRKSENFEWGLVDCVIGQPRSATHSAAADARSIGGRSFIRRLTERAGYRLIEVDTVDHAAIQMILDKAFSVQHQRNGHA